MDDQNYKFNNEIETVKKLSKNSADELYNE